ncbi:MAG: hypothetical protein ACR2MG_16640 [Pyrinomonadaceae bacterium]
MIFELLIRQLKSGAFRLGAQASCLPVRSVRSPNRTIGAITR